MIFMSLLSRITINPAQCGGRPCIRGMRIRVKDVLDLLAAGVSPEDILRDYPYLEKEDIQAALEFAAAQSDHVVLRVG
jgi:uncharacterized protein (DUF433 family)